MVSFGRMERSEFPPGQALECVDDSLIGAWRRWPAGSCQSLSPENSQSTPPWSGNSTPGPA